MKIDNKNWHFFVADITKKYEEIQKKPLHYNNIKRYSDENSRNVYLMFTTLSFKLMLT